MGYVSSGSRCQPSCLRRFRHRHFRHLQGTASDAVLPLKTSRRRIVEAMQTTLANQCLGRKEQKAHVAIPCLPPQGRCLLHVSRPSNQLLWSSGSEGQRIGGCEMQGLGTKADLYPPLHRDDATNDDSSGDLSQNCYGIHLLPLFFLSFWLQYQEHSDSSRGSSSSHLKRYGNEWV
jgi:hypothetical protein